jgi:hypothetical protein
MILLQECSLVNLERLQKETNSSSLAEVIRRALAPLYLAVDHDRNGGDIVLRQKRRLGKSHSLRMKCSASQRVGV